MHSHQSSEMAQDTAQLPSSYMLDAPRTPMPSPESLAALAQFVRETPPMHAVEISVSWEEQLQGSSPRLVTSPAPTGKGNAASMGSHARALYIPPMTNYSRTPGEGELLLGCCTLFVMALLVVGACYYFLMH